MTAHGRQARRLVAATAVAVGLLWAEAAAACPVCYGETDSPMAAAADASILFMAILTYGLIVSAGVGFVVIRRRALRARRDGETANVA